MSRSRRATRSLLLCSVTMLTMALCAGPALADSATITVTTTTGESDPSAGVPRVFTLTGTSAVTKYVYVKYRAPGGAACAPSASTDAGDDFLAYGREVNGAFNIQLAHTWRTPGTYVFCIWIASSSSAVSTPFTQAITFRSPTGTITATVNPITPLVNTVATITVTGASEAPAYVFASYRAAGGAPCAATYGTDSGSGLISNREVNGAFSTQTTFTPTAAGPYQLCLWLAESSSDPNPIAGPQPQLFNVARPPAPCIVPQVKPRVTLATIRARLRRANCTPGTVRRVRSATVRKNRVVRLAPSSGRTLRPKARVTIYVSRGRR